MKIGLISDAHGHVEALQRGLRVLERCGADKIVFLGDAVGYIPDADALRVVLSGRLVALAGNHEAMLLARSWGVRDDIYRLAETQELLGDDERSAIAALSPSCRLSIDGLTVLLVHANPENPLAGYIYPDTPLPPVADGTVTVVAMGHTHRPFIRREHGRLWVNAGSCGLPRDVGGLGSVALLDTSTGDCRILRFDIADLAPRLMSRFSLHESVMKLLSRPPAGPIIGEFVHA